MNNFYTRFRDEKENRVFSNDNLSDHSLFLKTNDLSEIFTK